MAKEKYFDSQGGEAIVTGGTVPVQSTPQYSTTTSRKNNSPVSRNVEVPSSELLGFRLQKIDSHLKKMSRLMHFVVLQASGQELQRAKIASMFYHYETQPISHGCNGPSSTIWNAVELRNRHCSIQSVITRMLHRLEQQGVIHLIHPGKYVKAIRLTPYGHELAEYLNNKSK